MPETGDFLVEIGTEELPPKALGRLARAFSNGIQQQLENSGFTFESSQYFCTPRRLAVRVRGALLLQPAQQQEKRGPALNAAFDAQGNPTKAAEGFARSCGVSVADLGRLETDKGSWLVHTSVSAGASLADTLADFVAHALTQLPIPKRMRWGNTDYEFVRPVHWLLLMLDDQVIAADVMGVQSGNLTFGHRFHHPGAITVDNPETYAEALETHGKVIVDSAQRRAMIDRQIVALAKEVGGTAVVESELLDEVTALVEWPVGLLGNFERRFLDVPHEALISTMRDNQKYFHVIDNNGNLLPHFITIANIESSNPDSVRSGNERVIRPRFSDAEFFWQQDLKVALSTHQEALKSMVFQKQLGSLFDKAQRVGVIAESIALDSGYNVTWATRAAALAKCDLLTLMVQEFPDLQGTMGRYYASHGAEPEQVAVALEEQYWPRFAGDKLPATDTGRVLALAERLDTLVALFAIGQPPSGTKDPFALRRAALGIARLLIELDWDLDLQALLAQTAKEFPASLQAEQAVDAVTAFVMERLRGYYSDQGHRPDEFEAVLECNPTRPVDFDKRLKAVAAFRQLPEAASLAGANKRIRNILRKIDGQPRESPNTDLLVEPAERELAETLSTLQQETEPLIQAGDYSGALGRLARLKQPVDEFFDQVMVMDDDPKLRDNRLSLLGQLSAVFLRVADFSRLQS